MKINDRVHQLRVQFNITPEITRYVYVYIITGKKGCYLVDAGVKGCDKKIEEYIHKIGKNRENINAVLLTHSHPDHIGALKTIKEMYSCCVYASRGERDWIEDIDLQYEKRPIPGFYSLVDGSVTVDRILSDGDLLCLEPGITIQVIGAPGHSRESLCFYYREQKILFTGDSIPEPSDALIYEDSHASEETLKRLGFSIPTDKVMSELSVGQQQMIEICKALMVDAKVIIMDEPTAALTQSETEVLFEVMQSLRKKGVSIVYISHRMEEIFELCDRISVLRDGTYIGTKKIPETNMNEIVKMMIGREIGERYPKRDCAIGDEVFRVEGLTKEGVFRDVDFSVKAGEVLGVSGLMGAGRTEIMQAIFGNLPYDRGSIFINGKQEVIKNPLQAIEHGIGFITEDRKTEGLLLEESIEKNVSLTNLGRISGKGKVVISREKEKGLVTKAIEELHIRCFGPGHECVNLSGGNQQKVVFAKWIYTEPRILILDEPTRGVDIGAKKEIYSIINQLAKKGVAIIMVSSELPEVLGMSDRIMVVREGLVRGIIGQAEADQEKIMTLATGGTLS